MNLLDEYKCLYFESLARKDKINAKASIGITFLTAQISAVIFMIKEVARCFNNTDIYSYLFFDLICLSLALLGRCIYFFIKTFFNYEYRLVPVDGINRYIKRENSLKNTSSANKNIEEMLKRLYSAAAEWNHLMNNKKESYNTRLFGSIIVSFSSIVVTFIFWAIFWSKK